jgi:alpha-ketoglutarate-dependent taurine dioxygenase
MSWTINGVNFPTKFFQVNSTRWNHESTGQKQMDSINNVYNYNIVEVKYEKENDVTHVCWNDGFNETFRDFFKTKYNNVFGCAEMYYHYDKQIVKWDKNVSMDEITSQHMEDIKRIFDTYGIVFVKVEETSIATFKTTVNRIGTIFPTFYGEIFGIDDNEEKNDEFNDIGFTSVAMNAHQDGLYFKHRPDIISFMKTINKAEGGESRFCDTFNVVSKLTREEVDILSKVKVGYKHTDANRVLANAHYTIEFIPGTDILESTSFNVEDRTYSGINPDDVIAFEHAYKRFNDLIAENELVINLPTDMVVIIDNKRVTHARNAFTGERQLIGCYADYYNSSNFS